MAVTTVFTQAVDGRQRVGREHEVRGTLALSGTYDSAKVPVTAAQLGLGRITSLVPGTAQDGTVALATEWVGASNYIKVYETAGTVDLPFDEFDGGSMASYSIPIVARGL